MTISLLLRSVLLPVVLLMALAGCAGMGGGAGSLPAAEKPAVRVNVSTEQGGRFIALTGRQLPHAEPFLGVPGTNFFTLRSWIDTRNRETVHQLYVADSYAGTERTWNAARDAQGRELRFVAISKNEITCERGCSYAEEFAAVLPEPQLRESLAGMTVTFAARSGAEKTIAVPGDMIKDQLAAVDNARSALPVTAAAAQPPPPPR